MRVVFMGTPEFAVPTLHALIAAGHEVVAAYSQPPRPAGRGKKLQPSPVHLAAQAAGIAVHTPISLKGADEQATFAAHRADVAVVAAYGLILPQAVLDAPRHGCLNVHGSILPRWLDTGPMRAAVRTPVDRKTAGALTAELAALGAGAMIDVLADLPGHPPVVQPDHGVTYAAKIDKAESRLDFTQPAAVVERSVRAFAPAPGAFFELDGERYRVLAAEAVAGDGDPGTVIDAALTIACGAGALRPSLVQRAGRPAMDTPALLRGRAIAAGTRLA